MPYLYNTIKFLVFLMSYKIVTASNTNFKVKSFTLCNNTQGLFKFRGNITKENDIFYATARIIFPIPLDENIGVMVKIDYKVMNSYIELFTIREKNMCKAANIYGGEMWYDVQRRAQMIPKACPIRAGRYEVHHMEMNFNKVALQTFPFGDLKFTIKAVDNKNPDNNLLCFILEVENIPN